MKPFLLTTLLLLALNGLAGEMRAWRSRDGSQTLQAQYVAIRDNDTVVLRSGEKQNHHVPIAKLSPEDQDYLFEAETRKALGGTAEKIEGLAYRQGEILGPLEALDGSSFYLYVPKSLAHDRAVPLMLYTGPTGGKMLHIRGLIKGAEVTGWIVAVVVESDYYNSVDVNRGICNSVVQTLLDTAPVDPRRLYFAGFSAGASVSYYNEKKWKACGLIPMSTYIPPSLDPPSCDTVIISGGSDFNRYTSAWARGQIGAKAVHRFHGEGHKTAPPWMMHEAMALLETRWLQSNPYTRQQEKNRFIYSMINWIDEFKDREPHRAYYWVRMLKDTLRLNVLQRAKLDPLFEQLNQSEQNRLYVNGLDALDRLSLSFLSTVTRESRLNYKDDALTVACIPLLQTYQHTPVIKDALLALCTPTDEPACVQPHWEE